MLSFRSPRSRKPIRKANSIKVSSYRTPGKTAQNNHRQMIRQGHRKSNPIKEMGCLSEERRTQ
jgi:hypothetical protein